MINQIPRLQHVVPSRWRLHTHTTLADLFAHLSAFDDDFLVEHQTDIIQCFSHRDRGQLRWLAKRDRIAAICCDLFWDYKEERAAGALTSTFSKISAIVNTEVENAS